MNTKFKVGDRVMATQDKRCEIADVEEEKIKRVKIKKGMTGTIICIAGGLFGVEFDDYINGHSCDGTGHNGYCYYCPSAMIERYGARKRTNTVKLKVGDRVKCLRPTDSKKEIVGKHGTVIDVRGNNISVEFDEHINGHTCNERGLAGYCWNCERDTLEKIQITKKKFKVGDRVVAKEDASDLGVKIKKGMTGTVIDCTRSLVDVEFDDYINGHNNLGKGKDGHCWSCMVDMIDKIPSKPEIEDVVVEKSTPQKFGKFTVGDRVIAKEDMGFNRIKKGMTGKVIGGHDCKIISVEFDEHINGHDCFGKGKDGFCWNCPSSMIDKILKDSEETQLKDITLEKGDIVTLHTGTIIVVPKDNVSVKDLDICSRIIKIERPTGYEVLYEAPEDILDKEEKEYLTAVLKPFRNRTTYIKKVCFSVADKEYIKISIYTSKSKREDIIDFPYFKKGTMYKGMEANKEYSLKELGL